MAIFRVVKTKDYTIMSNHHLKNRAISLKAKGLLSLMLSLPDEWSFSLKGLVSLCVEGVDAVRQGVMELEQAGYIVRTRTRDEKGCLRGTEYVIYEHPQSEGGLPPDAATPGQPPPSQPALDEPALNPPVSDAPASAEPILDEPALENPILGKRMLDCPAPDHPTLDFPTLLNTYTNQPYTNPIHNGAAANPNPNQYPNPSYPAASPVEAAGRQRDGIRMGWDEIGMGYAAADLREMIHQQIAYDVLLNDKHITKGRLDELVEIMVETLGTTSDTLTISGKAYPSPLVRERILKINSNHIQYIFFCLDRTTSDIKRIKGYLLTALYNAPTTMDGYYAAMVNHEHGGFALDDF